MRQRSKFRIVEFLQKEGGFRQWSRVRKPGMRCKNVLLSSDQEETEFEAYKKRHRHKEHLKRFHRELRELLRVFRLRFVESDIGRHRLCYGQ